MEESTSGYFKCVFYPALCTYFVSFFLYNFFSLRFLYNHGMDNRNLDLHPVSGSQGLQKELMFSLRRRILMGGGHMVCRASNTLNLISLELWMDHALLTGTHGVAKVSDSYSALHYATCTLFMWPQCCVSSVHLAFFL